MALAPSSEIPLVGRTDELNRIVGALKEPGAAAFVLAGAPGVGKTRLAGEAAKAASGLGMATARVFGSTATAAIPFGAFAPFLPAHHLGSGDLLGLLKQAGSAVLDRAGPDGRMLLVADDAHLLDDGSAALLQQLVQRGSCSVLITLRTPGPAPEPVTALWKDGAAERIDLDPLDERGVDELVARFLGGPVSGSTVRRLWEASGGNALWLRELLVGAVQSGALDESGGMWALRRPLAAPERLLELVANRLGGLDPGTVYVVELVAVGEPLGLPLLAQVTNEDALEDAERHGFVRATRDGQRTEVRLAHPVYGEALRQSMPRSHLRRISALLAQAVQAAGARRREDLLRLARWQLESGGPGDPELLSRAAQRASLMFDIDLARRLARKAISSGGGVSAGLVLGECEFRSGNPGAADAVFASLVPLCADDSERATVASARAYNLSILMGRGEEAAAVVNDALATVSDVPARLKLLGRLATNRLMGAEPASALEAAQELLASHEDDVVSRGCFVASTALALLGRGRQALEIAQRGFEASGRTPGGTQLPEAQLIGAVLGHAAGGELAQGQAVAARGYEACLAAGDKEGQASFSVLGGLVDVERGRLGEAARHFLEGATVNRDAHDVPNQRWSLGGVALAEGMAGHAAAAANAVAELDELPAGWTAIFETDLVERGRAWTHVAAGEISRGRQQLRESAERAQSNGLVVAEARLRHDLARLGEPASVSARLTALSESTPNELVAALAAHARAMAQRSAAGLEAAGATLEALGAALLAAEAYQAAAGLHRDEGAPRRANAAALNSDRLRALCGDVSTPALSEYLDAGHLTRREREVATLAAGGLASKDIAAKLFVSVRTVDNHLQNAYTKLGVSSRECLALALGGATPA
ncbi:MAG TPA: LuxR C-terminal-related transcriptional regulator [Acidimicrobiales bacterium]|nr:LuxR C-terminal-related transcriptional regulator [Acidimicrobiales bacterium]